jgi:hypothetical protein
MTEYVKRVKKEQADQQFYHWHEECPNYPIRGKETILIFKNKPQHVLPCPKCTELGTKKTNEAE